MTRIPAPTAAPRSRRTGRPSRAAAWLALAVLAAMLLPAAAAASPDTLRRGLSNIMMGPFDMLLSPIQGMNTVVRNLGEIDDSRAVRITYAVPGFAWLTLLDFSCGMIRILTGTLETIPGVILFASESDVDPLFDPVEDAKALFEWENPLIDVEDPWVYYNP
nr:hypothetical protein [Myxococcota bacterium]